MPAGFIGHNILPVAFAMICMNRAESLHDKKTASLEVRFSVSSSLYDSVLDLRPAGLSTIFQNTVRHNIPTVSADVVDGAVV